MSGEALVDSWVEAQMSAYSIPGMVVGIFRGREPEYLKAFGLADIEHGVPVRTDSIFQICSITKQFAAVALLLLQEDGALSLDDPASRHFEAMPDAWSEITIRELLSHTSGINDRQFDLEGGALTRETMDQAATTLFRPRGVAWEYSNLGFRILGDVIEKASGAPFFEYLQGRIFDPLGMAHTHPNWEWIVPNRAKGYNVAAGKFRNAVPLVDRFGGAAGGLISSVGDLHIWSRALMEGGLLKPESRQQMLEPARLNSGDIAHSLPNLGGYGLGVVLDEYGGQTIEKHAGGYDGASTQLTRMKNADLTVVLLTNSGAWHNRPWVGEAVAALWLPEFMLRRLVPETDPLPERLDRVRSMIKRLEGGFVIPDEVSSRILALPPEDLLAWSAEFKDVNFDDVAFVRRVRQGARDTFYYRYESAGPRQLIVSFDSAGKIDGLMAGPLVE